jgi:hypothetical protein
MNAVVSDIFVVNKMSQLDTELTLLKQRLAMLEERKRVETEKDIDKKENPMNVLQLFIDDKKKQIERNNYSKNVPLAQYYDREKVSFLEPILYTLTDILKRLDMLEKSK